MSKTKTRYSQIILKISGEAFVAPKTLNLVVRQILDAYRLRTKIGIVVGGGNFMRGKMATDMDRLTADRIGLIATVANGLLLESALKPLAKVCHLSALPVPNIVEPYSQDRALEILKNGHLLVLSGGTGNPYFTTDTAAALRAAELKADILIKGTKVAGVYSADPKKDPKAVKYDKISYSQTLKQDLKIMDATAFTLCQENQIPIVVLNIFEPNSLKKVLVGKKIGSMIC
ncbi:MAG: UMP kinase [candidate division WOR-3 bacterium]